MYTSSETYYNISLQFHSDTVVPLKWGSTGLQLLLKEQKCTLTSTGCGSRVRSCPKRSPVNGSMTSLFPAGTTRPELRLSILRPQQTVYPYSICGVVFSVIEFFQIIHNICWPLIYSFLVDIIPTVRGMCLNPPGHLRPGGFHQSSGQNATAVECTYNKTTRKTNSLTHFILLFNEANKMPGCPRTSHIFVVEI